jgi:hypothetical protein
MACPRCGTRRAINVPQQCPRVLDIVGEKSATITCRCGAIFKSYFDLRRHPRKAVQLPGELRDAHGGTKLSAIVVSSLSVTGLGFVPTTTLSLHVGEIYTVHFVLDDAEQSNIHERIIIRRFHGNTIGAAFYPAEQYNYALDFYVYGAQLCPPQRPLHASPRRLYAAPTAP